MKDHAALVIHDGVKVLFIQRSEMKKTLPNIWSFPTGTIEDGEGIEVTAVREAMEELNIEVKTERILGVKELPEFGVRLHFVACTIESGFPAIKEVKEIKSLRWMTFDEFFADYPDSQIGHGLIYLRKIQSCTQYYKMIHENTYKKVNFNGAKGIIFIGDKMLMYRRDSRPKNYPLCIDLPGGGRDGNESPFETFKREAKEEFGINIEEQDICFSGIHESYTHPGENSYFIVAKPLDVKESDIVFGNEGLEWFLISPEDLLTRTDGVSFQQEMVRKYLNNEW